MKKVYSTDQAPAAIGPYSQAVEVDNTLYVSGQIPLNPATMEVVGDSIEEQTHQVMKNVGAILKEAGLNYSNLVKTTILLDSMDDFATVNDIYASYLEEPYPTRAAFEVSRLPKDVKVEIEGIAKRA
ncbi:2-iminobutanoate/2-iminopropanoate deaminase [Alkalibacillus filiformis]|uniref:2-iminobutanoate/2-iminopropanoate deaminase n=1 Tax=Alkalibacillus filiformis TaxID=200990 RepID=A0ABU0DUL1_9BACI|nr:RidA family protein [Alkalibacillus filiformis]MDQ0352126.1 2-iminobutanoate/2-iminopropanoate deaminase [Alkalibacillus filiformis]